MIPNCTLITACYYLKKYNNNCRSIEETIINIYPLLRIPCYLVIYTDIYCIEDIKKYRDNLNSLTHYIVNDFESIKLFKYNDLIKKNRLEYHPTKDERTCSESHLLCCNKFNFVLEIMELNPFKTEKFGWIDGSVKKKFTKIATEYKTNMLLEILNETKPDKFYIQQLGVASKDYKYYRREYYEEYRWLICGCLFICGKEVGTKILSRLNEIFEETTLQGYGHAEEMFYLEVLDEFYDDIEKSYGDYNMILNNFLKPTIGYNYILNNIIKYFIYFEYYRECYDCCRKLLDQIENFKVNIDYNIYFLILFYYYVSSYYIDKNKTIQIKEYILDLIKCNPLIEYEYLKNKEYFDEQFNYV